MRVMGEKELVRYYKSRVRGEGLVIREAGGGERGERGKVGCERGKARGERGKGLEKRGEG